MKRFTNEERVEYNDERHKECLPIKDESVDNVAWLPVLRLKGRVVFKELPHICNADLFVRRKLQTSQKCPL